MNEPKPTTSPKSSKLIAIIVSGILLLVIAVLAIIFFVNQNTVTRSDYRAASDQYQAVKAAGTAVGKDVSGVATSFSSPDEEKYTKATASTKSSIQKLEAEIDALGNLKAMKTGEGKEKYEAFDQQFAKYLDNANSILASVEALRPAFVTCSNTPDYTGGLTQEIIAAAEECIKVLKTGSEQAPNPTYKKYAAGLSEQYGLNVEVLKKTAAIPSGDSALSSVYRTAYSIETRNIQDKVTEISKTFSEEIKKKDAEVNVNSQADALSDFFKAKLSEPAK